MAQASITTTAGLTRCEQPEQRLAGGGDGVERRLATAARDDRRDDQRTVGNVRIVSGILDHAGCAFPSTLSLPGQSEGGSFAAGQADGHRIGESPVNNAA